MIEFTGALPELQTRFTSLLYIMQVTSFELCNKCKLFNKNAGLAHAKVTATMMLHTGKAENSLRLSSC